MSYQDSLWCLSSVFGHFQAHDVGLVGALVSEDRSLVVEVVGVPIDKNLDPFVKIHGNLKVDEVARKRPDGLLEGVLLLAEDLKDGVLSLGALNNDPYEEFQDSLILRVEPLQQALEDLSDIGLGRFLQ